MAGSRFPDERDLVARDQITAGPVAENAERAAAALELVEQLQDDFRERDELYEEIDRVIFLQNEVKIPEAYQATALQIRSPYPWHISNQITAALSVNPPKVHFDPVKLGEAGRENQGLREAFFEGSWQRQEEDARRQLFRLLMHSLTTKGEAIAKTIERTKVAWGRYSQFVRDSRERFDRLGDTPAERDRLFDAATEEYKKSQPYPIATTDVPPESFYYVKNEDGFSVCAEVKAVPYYQTLERYRLGLNHRGEVVPEAAGLPRGNWRRIMDEANLQTLTMCEVWTWDEALYVLKDVPKNGNRSAESGYIAKRIRHRYGDRATRTLRGPYHHCFGTTTSSRAIGRQGLSILFGFLHLFPLLDSLLTLQSQAAYLTGFPILKRVQPDTYGLDNPFGADSEEQQSLYADLEPGKIWPFDIAAVEPPRTGTDLSAAIANTIRMLDMALPAAAQGVLGDSSGYALNQAAHAATLAWNPLIANAQRMLAERVGWESWLIENVIKERVYVWGVAPDGKRDRPVRRFEKDWLGIAPADLDGVHRYRVELDPASPTNRTIELRLHRELLDMRLESRDQAILALGNNPLEVRRAWLYEEMLADPAVRNTFKQKVFERLGTIEKALMERAQGQEPQAPPTPNAQIAGSIPPGLTPSAAMAPGQPQQPGQPPFAVPGGPAPPVQPLPPGQPGVAPGQPGGIPGPPQRAVPIPGG